MVPPPRNVAPCAGGVAWAARPRRPWRLAAALALLAQAVGGVADCAAQSPRAYDGAWTLTLDNDIASGTDNNYTNGFGVSWMSSDIRTHDDQSLVRRWGDFWSFLPFVGNEGYRTYVSWSLAQEIYTPSDITLVNPAPNDQPYAGVLSLDNLIYARNDRWTHVWQLKLGVVGPSSQAERFQTELHRVLGSKRPQGWRTQLPDEPIVNVEYTAAYLAAQGHLSEAVSWKLVPVANVALGNYFTGAGLGVYGEFGWNLVDVLGSSALRQGFNVASTVGAGPTDRWTLAFVGGAGGYRVARYLPLDGTLFRHSRAAGSQPSIGMFTYGLTARRGDLVFFLGKTHFTKTFAAERERPDFGTLSVSWYY